MSTARTEPEGGSGAGGRLPELDTTIENKEKDLESMDESPTHPINREALAEKHGRGQDSTDEFREDPAKLEATEGKEEPSGPASPPERSTLKTAILMFALCVSNPRS